MRTEKLVEHCQRNLFEFSFTYKILNIRSFNSCNLFQGKLAIANRSKQERKKKETERYIQKWSKLSNFYRISIIN